MSGRDNRDSLGPSYCARIVCTDRGRHRPRVLAHVVSFREPSAAGHQHRLFPKTKDRVSALGSPVTTMTYWVESPEHQRQWRSGRRKPRSITSDRDLEDWFNVLHELAGTSVLHQGRTALSGETCATCGRSPRIAAEVLRVFLVSLHPNPDTPPDIDVSYLEGLSPTGC